MEARRTPGLELGHPRDGLRATVERARREARFASSVVSVPRRNRLWGDAAYRGNCDGTLIKDLILRYDTKSVADPMEGSGTTRDVVAWLNDEYGLGLSYWGSDLQQGFNLLSQPLPGTYDLVWVHPPYWNIVPYSTHRSDLSNVSDYGVFLSGLRRCLLRCIEAVNPGGRLAVLVGDVRRAGRYHPLARDVMNFSGDLGELCSTVIKVQHNVRSNARSYSGLVEPRILHETCVIFRKPSPTR